MGWWLRVCVCVCLCVAGSQAAAQAEETKSEERPRNEKAFRSAVRRLSSEDAQQRVAAADEMGRRGYRYRHEIAALLRPILLKDPVSIVRAAAGRALGRLGAKEAVPELIAALSDDSSDVRVVAAAALWRLPDPAAVPALLVCTEDKDATVREWCALALGVLGDKQAVPAMIRLLRDEKTAVRLSAIRSLGRIGDRAGIEPLMTYVQSRRPQLASEEVEEIISAIASVRDPAAARALLDLLERERSRTYRRLIVVALGQIGDKRALSVLRKLRAREADPALLQALREAIGQLEAGPRPQAAPTAKP